MYDSVTDFQAGYLICLAIRRAPSKSSPAWAIACRKSCPLTLRQVLSPVFAVPVRTASVARLITFVARLITFVGRLITFVARLITFVGPRPLGTIHAHRLSPFLYFSPFPTCLHGRFLVNSPLNP